MRDGEDMDAQLQVSDPARRPPMQRCVNVESTERPGPGPGMGVSLETAFSHFETFRREEIRRHDPCAPWQGARSGGLQAGGMDIAVQYVRRCGRPRIPTTGDMHTWTSTRRDRPGRARSTRAAG